jgi:hypothetical protein
VFLPTMNASVHMKQEITAYKFLALLVMMAHNEIRLSFIL